MEITRIVPSDSKLWEQVWKLYNESFPQYERRRINSHERACEDAAYHTDIAIENGNLLALIFYWEYPGTAYVEHVAVNPAMRGNNVGSTLMREFMERYKDSTVILEIDPPVDEISKRRLGFYERLGFKDTGFSYQHPSYTKNGTPHHLNILSWPEAVSEHEFERFKEFMFKKVMTYID